MLDETEHVVHAQNSGTDSAPVWKIKTNHKTVCKKNVVS